MEAASIDRMVVAADFPGYGESDAPVEPISAELYARSIWEVVDALELCRADAKRVNSMQVGSRSDSTIDLFGIHAGAKLAVEATRQRPDSVRKIVLSSAAVLTPEEVDFLRTSLPSLPLDEEGTRFQHMWRAITQNRGPDMSLQMCATSLAEMLRHGDRYTWGSQAVFDYNARFPDALQSIRQPVALLNPADELYDMTPRTLGYLRHAELIELPDWTHGYLDAHAAEAARMILEWLGKT